ncbi:uncharacterized protein LOC119687693 [Teleopsis dalmanni]|uniref:uncharacterized protein LOC119687693 n=1 Tax=Teleopsis dalmanni TaxID=139649 RepID=UPI0018CDA325|nr:uncharacterized protein LOC119687693 [Teleopsis dalmanni]XP_037958035.1 uncharacterized protein LOC119687693 [Teleopsis dalmanni]
MEKLDICANEAQISCMKSDNAIPTENATIYPISLQKSEQLVEIDVKVINEKTNTSPPASLQNSKAPVEILEDRNENFDKCEIGFETDIEIITPTLSEESKKLVEISQVYNEMAKKGDVGLELITSESITSLPTSTQKSEELVANLDIRHEQTGRHGVAFEIIIAEATSARNVRKNSIQSDKKLSTAVINQKMSTVADRRRCHIDEIRAKLQMPHMNTSSQKSEEIVESLEVRHEQSGKSGTSFELVIAEATSVPNVRKCSIPSDTKLSKAVTNQKMSTVADRRRCHIDEIRAKTQKLNKNTSSQESQKLVGNLEVRHEQTGKEGVGFEMNKTEPKTSLPTSSKKSEELAQNVEVCHEQTGKSGVSFEIIIAEATSVPKVRKSSIQSDKKLSTAVINQKMSTVADRRRCHVDEIRANTQKSNMNTSSQKSKESVENLEICHEQTGRHGVGFEMNTTEPKTSLPTSSQKSEESVENLEVRHEQTGKDGVGFEIIIAEATSVPNERKYSIPSDTKLSKAVINQKMSTVADRRRCHIEEVRAKTLKSSRHTSSQKSKESAENLKVRHEQTGRHGVGFKMNTTELKTSLPTSSQKSEESVENLEVRHEQTGKDGIGFEIIVAEAASVPNVRKSLLQSDKKLSRISALNQIKTAVNLGKDRRRSHIDEVRAKTLKSSRNTSSQKSKESVENLEIRHKQTGKHAVSSEMNTIENKTSFPTSSQKSKESVENLEVRHEQTGKDGVGFEIIIAEAASVPNVRKSSLQSDKKLSKISALNQIKTAVNLGKDRRRNHTDEVRAKALKSSRHTSSQKSKESVENLKVRDEQTGRHAVRSEMNTIENKTFFPTSSQKSEESVENLEVRHEQTGKDGVGFEIIIAEATSVPNVRKCSIPSDTKLSTLSVINQKMSTAEERRRCHIDAIRAKAQKSNIKIKNVIQRKNEGKTNLPVCSYNNSTKRGAIIQRGSSKFKQNGKVVISNETCVFGDTVKKSSCSQHPSDKVEKKSCDGKTKTDRRGKYEIKDGGDTGAPTENLKSETQDDKGRLLY